MPPVSSLLIANRGEIAVRIARTAKALGCRTIAVHSTADRDALHVACCDTAIEIGPAPVAESYLSIPAILDAAHRSGADAVHPGYGFLSENAAFADAVTAAGLTFLGPPASAIAAMGNKAAAKRRLLDAGVPCVPGYQGADQSEPVFVREAARIGFPVMVKAAAGGGGRGMRLVARAADLPAALAAARAEAASAFGSGELILEKAVVDARHVEIQVFADTHGNVIHLGERDCSVQRRHQKVIEEAPSPAVTPELRARMGAAAVTAAKSIGYVGAGTVEFLLGADGAFYFLEMNTRLQVEHPVTEAVTGLDLVAWQIQIARGETLPLRQDQIRLDGHAMEVRLYAEDPAQNFLPQSGDVVAWRPSQSIRVDGALRPRDVISPHYDPMVAKLIAHGATRNDARHKLIAALRETHLLGPVTNQAFLIDLLGHADFAAGHATTGFIGEAFASWSHATPDGTTLAIAAALLLDASSEVPASALAGWSSTGHSSAPVLLDLGDVAAPRRVRVAVSPGRRFAVTLGDTTHHIALAGAHDANAQRITVDGATRTVVMALAADGALHLSHDGHAIIVRDTLRAPRLVSDAAATSGELRAPMNGRVVRLAAKAGDAVKRGQCVIVVEAMKMQHEVTSPRDGTVTRIVVSEGQQVATRAVLAEVG